MPNSIVYGAHAKYPKSKCDTCVKKTADITVLIKVILFLFSLLIGSYASAQTQIQMNEMSAKDYKKKDAELNTVYKQLTAVLGNSKDVSGGNKARTLLMKTQRAWIQYRDAHCAYTESSYDGGSMQPLVYYGCMRQVTEERIKQLKEAIAERNAQ